MSRISLCITSFNRFGLLEKTLDTFMKLVKKPPIIEWIINEDSGNKEMVDRIKEKYGWLFNEILVTNRIGQLKSIDNMYSKVNTKYILHLEDDYKFYGNPNFIEESIDILENNPDIHRVGLTHNCPKDWKDIIQGGTFDMMKPDVFGGWGYWSFTPSLIRLEDYKKAFPNGYSEFHEDRVRLDILEYKCNLRAKELGYRSAILKNGSCITTGNNQSTYKR